VKKEKGLLYQKFVEKKTLFFNQARGGSTGIRDDDQGHFDASKRRKHSDLLKTRKEHRAVHQGEKNRFQLTEERPNIPQVHLHWETKKKKNASRPI